MDKTAKAVMLVRFQRAVNKIRRAVGVGQGVELTKEDAHALVWGLSIMRMNPPKDK